jgi:hypothetical protein
VPHLGESSLHLIHASSSLFIGKEGALLEEILFNFQLTDSCMYFFDFQFSSIFHIQFSSI